MSDDLTARLREEIVTWGHENQSGFIDDEPDTLAVRLAEVARDELRLRLRRHWLAGIECDHEREADRATCACSEVDLGWHPSVAAAVESWISHVLAPHKEPSQ